MRIINYFKQAQARPEPKGTASRAGERLIRADKLDARKCRFVRLAAENSIPSGKTACLVDFPEGKMSHTARDKVHGDCV